MQGYDHLYIYLGSGLLKCEILFISLACTEYTLYSNQGEEKNVYMYTVSFFDDNIDKFQKQNL